MRKITQRLRAFRAARGWSQHAAARWYGVNVRTWRRWENAEYPAPEHVLNRLESYDHEYPATSR